MKLPTLSLEALLLRLVDRGRRISLDSPYGGDAEERRPPTTLRFKNATHHFLETQARAMNTSVQSLCMMILDGVAEATLDAGAGAVRAIRERFFEVMEAHGLDLPAVAELLSDQGITLSLLGDRDRLVDQMTPAVFEAVARVFHVRSDWLRGASSERLVSEEVEWYTSLRSAALTLLEHRDADRRPTLLFVRRVRADFQRALEDQRDSAELRENVAIVLQLTRTTPSGTPFQTFQLWQCERWNYAKCRHRMKFLIAFCEQARIRTAGHELPVEALDALRFGRQLPVSLLRRLGSVSWYPDNYAGFQFPIEAEREDWEAIKERYFTGDGLAQVAHEAGLPSPPNRP